MTEATDPGRGRSGYDPARDVLLDAHNLRGLAHPLRVRILGLLREQGPSTATALAGILGESSAATSYHLRQLAAYGFIEEDAGRGAGRERWWRSTHRSTYFDLPGDASRETALLGTEYLHGVVRAMAARMQAWVEALPGTPAEWRDAGTISDYRLHLTPDEARVLIQQLEEIGLAHRAPEDLTGADPAARPVSLQIAVLPQAGASEGGRA